jgi:hypothetical protein
MVNAAYGIWFGRQPCRIKLFFAWRLATDSLAVTSSLHRSIPRILPTCAVCGVDDEDAHHCMVRCTLARALRDGMRTVWSLPSETELRYTGNSWFLFTSWMVLQRTCVLESFSYSGGPGITGIMSSMATARPPLRHQFRSSRAKSSQCMQALRSLIEKGSRLCFRRASLAMHR